VPEPWIAFLILNDMNFQLKFVDSTAPRIRRETHFYDPALKKVALMQHQNPLDRH
jgi:hypothetical protein